MGYEIVTRKEDMSPSGYLRIKFFSNGDCRITVVPDGKSDSGVIEFCNNGGKSPETMRALNVLRLKMEDLGAEVDLKRLIIRQGSDGDIRVFIVEKIGYKLPNIDTEKSKQEILLRLNTESVPRDVSSAISNLFAAMQKDPIQR
jgi:hypothetical protein